jgi:hypothetical protein
VANGYLLTLALQQGGQLANVVLGFTDKANPVVLTTTNTQLVLDKAWQLLRTMMTSSVTCSGGTLRDLGGQAPGQVYELAAPPTPVGVGNPPDAVAAACTLIKWVTTNGTRSGKGRSFVPGIPSSAVQAGGRLVAAAHSSGIAPNLASYIAGTGTWEQPLQPAVISRKNGVAYPIISGAVAGVVGIQRRRMR